MKRRRSSRSSTEVDIVPKMVKFNVSFILIVFLYLAKNNSFYNFELNFFFIIKDDVMIREIDDADIKPKGKAKKKGSKENMNDSVRCA